MRLKNLFIVICLLIPSGLLTQCERYGNPAGSGEPDPDSDRPEWAGGETSENPHNNKDQGGTTGGRTGDYGDLIVIKRNENGVPFILTMVVDEKTIYLYQPLDTDGNELLYDQETGELLDPEAVVVVDFGRLDIVRSPQSVLDQAFEEAMKVLTATGASITLDFCGRLTSTYPDPASGEIIVKTIDSPRENMAIYQYIMTNLFVEPAVDGSINRLAFLGKDPYNFGPLDIAASCFAAGSDKTGTVIIDEVVYVDGFLDCIGLSPIENEYDYDFNNEYLWYFNFGDCDGDGNKYQYNRDVYKTRYIQYLNWYNEELGVIVHYEPGDPTLADERTFSIFNVMEGFGPDGIAKFTYKWNNMNTFEYQVKGFTIAVDDAVQVLEYIHGDSDILFLPDYEE